MFSVIARSSRNGGSGTIIITTTSTTAPAAARSACLPALLRNVFMRRCFSRRLGRRRRAARRRPGTAPRGSSGRSRRVACSARASGGSGTTATPCSRASSRMCSATRSWPLATTDRRERVGGVAQRDGVVRRVGDDDVGGRDRVHHARAGQLGGAAALQRLDLGGQLLLLVLVLDLLLVHPQLLLVLPALVGEVDDRRSRGRRPRHSGRCASTSVPEHRQQHGGGHADERGELVELRQQREQRDRADGDDLHDRLAALEQRVRAEDLLRAL